MGVFTDYERRLQPEDLPLPVVNEPEWYRSLLDASLMDVPFTVKNHEGSGGRKIITHEYVGRDNPEYEDMGEEINSFNLTGYVIGDDYFKKRDRLIEALKTKGPKKLVHPYLGVLQVVTGKFSYSESDLEGGMARFNIPVFLDRQISGTQPYPNTQSKAEAAKENMLDSIQAEFEAAYSIGQMAQSGIQNAIASVDKVIDVIDSAKKTVNSVAEFKRLIRTLKGKVIEIALSGIILAQGIRDILTLGSDIADISDPVLALSEMVEVYNGTFINPTNMADADYFAPTYAAGQIQVLTRQMAVANMVGIVSSGNYATLADAENSQSEVFSLLDEVLADPNVSDEVFGSVKSSRAALYNDNQDRLLTLPQVVKIDVNRSTNTLLLSYETYGNLSKESDIIKRNNIGHPLFITSSKRIEVVVDV